MRAISGMFTASSFLFLFSSHLSSISREVFTFCSLLCVLQVVYVGLLYPSLLTAFAQGQKGGRTDGPPNGTDKRSGELNSSNPASRPGVVFSPRLAGYICLFVCRSGGIPRWSDFQFYSSFSLFHQVFYSRVRFVWLVSWGFAYIFFLPLKAHSILSCFCILNFLLLLSLLCYGMTWMGYITIQFSVFSLVPPHFQFSFFFSQFTKINFPPPPHSFPYVLIGLGFSFFHFFPLLFVPLFP